MVWLLAGAALAAFAAFCGAGVMRILALAILAGGLALALGAYPALIAVELWGTGAVAGFFAARFGGKRLPPLARSAALAIAAAALCFASLGPAEGLF